MFFINFFRYLLGYVEMTVSGDFPERLLNLMAKNRIVPWNIKRKKKTIQMCVTNGDFKRIRKIRGKCGVKIHIIKKRGLRLKTRRFKLRYGFVAGLIIFMALQFFLGNFVWQIEVCGNKAVSENEVLKCCEELGIKRGVFKKSLDIPVLKEKIILKLPKTAWASINLEGSRVTVNISEIKNDGIVTLPSNIVSQYDCVIKDVKVTSGVGVVKKGQAVQKGDLLISGATDFGATPKFVTALGEIIGEVEKKYVFEENFATTQRVYNPDVKEKSVLEFFSLKIPLYLGEYGNNAETETFCDYFNFLGSKTPILLHKKRYKFYETRKIKLSKPELIEKTEKEFKKALKEEKISEYELISHNVTENAEGVKTEYEIRFVKNIGVCEKMVF